jgi:transposase
VNQPTLQQENTTNLEPKLFLAIELSEKSWTLAFGDGSARVRGVTVPVGDIARLNAEVAKARVKFGIAEQAPVLSCYEAGRDGFWVHRALEANGIKNMVVDASSIEVDRRLRRAKTDRLDAQKLLQQLVRHNRGERMRPVVVPTLEAEDARRDGREMERLKKERTGHVARIKSLLALHGARDVKLSQLEKAVDWHGEPLPATLMSELLRERRRLELVQTQIKELVARRENQLEQKEPRGW